MRIVLVGFGGVGRAVAQQLDARRAELYRAHGLSPLLIGVIDSRGAACRESGLDTEALLAAKRQHGTVAALEGCGLTAVEAERLIAECDAGLMVDATPSRVREPKPSMQRLAAAFRSGKHAITVNKGPLAAGMPALLELADHNRVQFRFSGTVGAGTPLLAFARECARGDEITSVRAILNGTTNFILSRMRETGEAFEQALAEAVRLGYAETDPSTDVDGIDTATKLVILANHVLGRRVRLDDVAVTGIRGVTTARMQDAAARGQTIKLVGEIGEGCRVAPREVDAGGPLDVPAHLNALSLSLRAGGEVTVTGRGAGVVETATAVLRDLIDIWHEVGGR
jgi:homoserine dehydrogenase